MGRKAGQTVQNLKEQSGAGARKRGNEYGAFDRDVTKSASVESTFNVRGGELNGAARESKTVHHAV
jgi:hypothetical protein